MLTVNVLHRVKKIGWQDSTGTGFTLEHNSKQYFVTAQHVLDDFSGGKIDLFDQGNPIPKTFEVVEKSSVEDDVIVLRAEEQLSPTFQMPATCAGAGFGQRAYFLGFPYGYSLDCVYQVSLPLVKSATLSHITKDNILLDGFANPGFSGGPVVFRPQEKANSVFCVAGIVTSYPVFDEPVFEMRGTEKTETEYFVENNPGMVHVTPIEVAMRLIERNQTGLPV
ncbi:MAG: serine protease [Paracoccaceae bacterium]